MREKGLVMPEELEVGHIPRGMADLLAPQQTLRRVISGSSAL